MSKPIGKYGTLDEDDEMNKSIEKRKRKARDAKELLAKAKPTSVRQADFELDDEKRREAQARAKRQKRRDYNQAERKWRRFTIVSLFVAPLAISAVSIIHMFDWFLIGNNQYLSYALGVAYEWLIIAALISLRHFGVLSFFTRMFTWILIILLIFLQVAGNVYSVYLRITTKQEIVTVVSEFIGMEAGMEVIRLLSFAIGAILPLTSLVFMKILANYWVKTHGRWRDE